jgi:predicted alpha-1,2-mannosidase
MIYLYDYVGEPWKTQSRIRLAVTKLYQATPDGMCGDEDTGQMSAWYVFSALGFYPVCPGDTSYCIGSPLFDRAVLTLAGQKTFVITADHNGPQHPYIRGAKLDSQPFDKVYLTHGQLVNGGEIVFDMASAPDHRWGTAQQSRPPATMPGAAP